MRKMFDASWIAETIIRHRLWCIAFSLIVLLGLGLGLPNLRFSPDMEQFFPENDPNTETHFEIEETYSTMDNLVIAIGVEDGTVFTPRTLNLIEELTEKSWRVPYSLRIDSITNYSYVSAINDDLFVEPFIENAISYDREIIDQKETAIESEELAYGAVISRDKKTAVINIVLDPPRDDIEKEYKESVEYAMSFLREAEDSYPEIEFKISGIVYVEYLSPILIKSQVPFLIPALLVVILLTLYLLLRSVVAVVGSFFVIVVSVISSMGAVGIIGGTVSQPFIMVPILIATLAVADCVHLFLLYFQHLDSPGSGKPAILESLTLNLQPLFLTSITTAIGFLSLNLTPIVPLQMIGNGIAVGVTLAFVFTIFLLAPLVSFVRITKPKQVNRYKTLSNRLGRFSLNNHKRFFFMIPAAACLLMLFIPLNQINDNPLKFYSERYSSLAADTAWLSERLGATFPVSYELTASNESVSDPEFLSQLDKFSEWLASNKEVLHVYSLSRIMKNLNRTLHGGDQEWYAVPEESDLSAQYLFFYEMSLPFGLDLNNSISQDKKSTKVVASLIEMGAKDYREFDEKVNEYVQANMPRGMVSTGSGMRTIFAFLGNVIATQLFYALGIGLVLITVTITLFFRSLRYGSITVLTNLLPIGVAFGIWGLVSGEVNMLVSLGMGTTLGIIVDFTVHFLSKYLLARREKNLTPEESVMFAFETVGFALIITTLSLCFGFLVLLLAFFEPLHGFALFSSIAFVSALLIDLFLFPALLMKWDKQHAT